MANNLVIVESPAKAKTIEKYLGKDYQVTSSYGHIRDLPSKDMSVDIKNNFKPTYVIPGDKKKTVANLKQQAKKAKTIWLATDEDREGEAIAWHLAQALSLKLEDTKRIVFHEITKPALLHAVENPRSIDKNLVDAQQARRVLDRLVGYELSPILWKKVRPGLSAGRVQSVAVRLIVEREREIEQHEAESYYKVSAILETDKKEDFKAEYSGKIATGKESEEFLQECADSSFAVADIETKPSTRNPSPPFTTSSLQQEASQKLGFSVKQTMTLAQRLYESGHITYMRTDSLNLSSQAIGQISIYIKKEFGDNYLKTRQYKAKSAGAQEAHEAIRPTDINRFSAGGDERQKKLYRLIWQRVIASQMAPAKLDKTVANISISGSKKQLTAKGEVIVFDGFLKAYPSKSQADARILPDLSKGQALSLLEMTATETYKKPSPRYTEASLVKKLEELGIGRPSTYAPTISTIQSRGYVIKGNIDGEEKDIQVFTLKNGKVTQANEKKMIGADKNKLYPTDTARVVNDFLNKYFKDIVDYDFTANVEQHFDEISAGQKHWQEVIEQFYGPFHKTVKKSESVSKQEASQARELGKDPKSGKPVLARFGRYGPMLQIGTAEDEEKPKFAPMPPGEKIETIDLKTALKAFQLPRKIGKTPEGEDIEANIGRYGPYVKYGSTYVSIKPEDPFTITHKKALELIEEKKKSDAQKHIKQFDKEGIEVLKGPYGPYVTDGKTNARVPKDQEPSKLTLKQCQDLLAERAKAKTGKTRKKR